MPLRPLHSYRALIGRQPYPGDADLEVVGVKAPDPITAARAVLAVTGCAVVVEVYRQDRGAA